MDSPRPRTVRRLLVAAALLALACAAPAQAGSLSLTGGSLLSQADPGETNRVTVSTQGSGDLTTYTVRDAGAPVRASLPCLGSACTGAVRSVRILLGDGNDTAVMPGAYGAAGGYVDGGAGNDNLTGGRAAGSGRNPETLTGGPGVDTLAPRDGGRATGGSNGDFLTCAGGTLGCRLEGEDGGDRLMGAGRTDALTGGPGNDFLTGRGGSDGFAGGQGDDAVDSKDGVEESVFCDDGASDTISGDPDDATYGCEVVSFTLRQVALSARRVRPKGSAARRGKRLHLRASARIRQASRGTRLPCTGGKVRFRVLVGKRLASRRVVKVGRACSARTRLRLPLRRRERKLRKVRIAADYLGNGWLKPRAGRFVTVKVRGARR